MKKVLAFILAVTLCVGLCACSGSVTGDTMQNDDVTIDGVFVDDSYVDKNGDPLKMVYVFLTLHSSSNIKADCSYTKLKIGENSYESTFYKGACQYMPKYYYSSFIEEVYAGEEFPLALTFKVAAADLTSTGKITLEDMDLPVRGLSFTSDKIQVCASPADIGNQVDPEGSAAEANKMKPADAATVKKVRNAVNGYYFEFYVTVGTMVEKYKLEFSAPNKFVLDTAYLDNSGTYEVYNGYVVLNYKTSNTPLYIAYDFNSGDISMYCADAFSIYE